MCNVSKQSTIAPQAKAKSTPSTTHPSPIPKQYCSNYQTNNCRRTNCKFLHEIDPSSKSKTKDDRSDNRSDKPTSSSNQSSNYKSNDNNKRYNNRANDNNDNASMSKSNSGPSHARLNRLQAQEDDFQSWSNVNSQGYRNASINTLSFKRKRLHQEAAIEGENRRKLSGTTVLVLGHAAVKIEEVVASQQRLYLSHHLLMRLLLYQQLLLMLFLFHLL